MSYCVSLHISTFVLSKKKTEIMDTKGYLVKEYNGPVKRYCQTLELKDNPELIAEYKKLHSPKGSWPEIRQGIREVGILEMEIYIKDAKLFMVVETPLDFEWSTAMAKLSTLPRQMEWEHLVDKFQLCPPGGSSDDKWKMMERIFYLYD